MQQPQSATTHHIVVDDRERNMAVVTALENQGAEIEIGRLRVGDYKVDDRLLVERKTVSDLAQSVISGRLFRQARQLAALSAFRSCVVIEGSPDDLQTGGISRPGYHGTLISLTLVYGLPVLRSASPSETASIILSAAGQLKRRAVSPPRRHGRKPTFVRRNQLLMLQEISYVGPDRATELLKIFGSPSGVARASLKQIRNVHGIGPMTAHRIWAVFHDLTTDS